MISKLNHTDNKIGSQIRAVFQESYAVEAKILKATNFPPLQRPLEDYLHSKNSFYGFYIKTELAGVVEIKIESSYIHIQSLVVMPDYFRQGIAQQLMDFVFSKIPSSRYMVETGVDNIPAVNLYLKNDFVEVKQWDTDHGVSKVRFERTVDL